MLHVGADSAGSAWPEASDFDRLRQLGELRSVVESEAGRRYLAEAYTGWPLEGLA
jgi:p-hydroxybenzoate 3-monooxygenase